MLKKNFMKSLFLVGVYINAPIFEVNGLKIYSDRYELASIFGENSPCLQDDNAFLEEHREAKFVKGESCVILGFEFADDGGLIVDSRRYYHDDTIVHKRYCHDDTIDQPTSMLDYMSMSGGQFHIFDLKVKFIGDDKVNLTLGNEKRSIERGSFPELYEWLSSLRRGFSKAFIKGKISGCIGIGSLDAAEPFYGSIYMVNENGECLQVMNQDSKCYSFKECPICREL